jgi:hypothetical protein
VARILFGEAFLFVYFCEIFKIMKVFVLNWGEYIIGTFSTKEKAEKAIEFYSQYEILKNEHDNDFFTTKIELDSCSDSMLDDIKSDGWFDINEEESTKINQFQSFFFLIIVLLIIACTILGFVTLIKIIFVH